MKLHHSGFIVKNIDEYQSKMIFEEKLIDLIDPIQNARLCLYSNYTDAFIELIQPLNENAFTWKSLQKFGNHFEHFCYLVSSKEEMEMIVTQFRLIRIKEPLPAIIFDNKLVSFYYNHNKQIVEFLINSFN